MTGHALSLTHADDDTDPHVAAFCSCGWRSRWFHADEFDAFDALDLADTAAIEAGQDHRADQS